MKRYIIEEVRGVVVVFYVFEDQSTREIAAFFGNEARANAEQFVVLKTSRNNPVQLMAGLVMQGWGSST